MISVSVQIKSPPGIPGMQPPGCHPSAQYTVQQPWPAVMKSGMRNVMANINKRVFLQSEKCSIFFKKCFTDIWFYFIYNWQCGVVQPWWLWTSHQLPWSSDCMTPNTDSSLNNLNSSWASNTPLRLTRTSLSQVWRIVCHYHHGLQAVNCIGAPKSLDVLKHSGKYIKKDIVILQLRENGLNYRWSEAINHK